MAASPLWLVALCLLTTSGRSVKLGTPMKNNPAAQVKPAQQTVDPNKITTSRKFDFHAKLDANFDLHWDFNETHITFETIVKTNGYIGLGISDNGRMFPADVAIGWIKDGRAHFSDRFAAGHYTPVKDTVQNWYLLGGVEQGDFTRLTMVRPLEPCDSQDKPIKHGTTRVIYAYHPSDPSSDDHISYHGAQGRGSKSILLLDPPSDDKKPTVLPDDVTTYDFLNYNYSVPGDDTTYRCTMWKMPDLGGKHHVIRFEPVIQAGHEKLVHHLFLYFCPGPLEERWVGREHECYKGEPREMAHCNHVFTGWTIGGTVFDFPYVAGASVGAPGDSSYFRLETHYDNPRMRTDFVDNSGLRLYLTKQLRQHDAGFLEVGVVVAPFQVIPPHNPAFMSTGYCHPECLTQALSGQEIRVFSNLLHSHLLGSKLRTRHFRNGVELESIAEDNNYDFDFQEMRYLPQERVVKAGDHFTVECEYDSTQRSGLTFGGLSTREEMCLSFLMYYPKVPLSICRSRLHYESLNHMSFHGVIKEVTKWDWTSQARQDQFKKFVEEAKILNQCAAAGKHMKFNGRMTDRPTVTSTRNITKSCSD